MKTSKSLIAAIQSGAMAWVEQREPPAMESLVLPDNPRLGDLIRKAYAEQTSIGWNGYRICVYTAMPEKSPPCC